MTERGRTEQLAELDEEIWALLEGELDAEQARRVEDRIACDRPLAARVAAIRSADGALRALPTPSHRAEVRARLRRRIEQQSARARKEPGRPIWAPRSRVWSALAVAAALLLFWRVFEHGREPLRGPAPGPSLDVERAPSLAQQTQPAEPDLPASPQAPTSDPLVSPRFDPPAVAPVEALAAALPKEAPGLVARVEPIVESIIEPAVEPERPLDGDRNPGENSDPSVLDRLSDEDLLLALELDLLEDFAVIQNIELLEALGPIGSEDAG